MNGPGEINNNLNHKKRQDMNYWNKWIGLSLIALAVFSACTDEVENRGKRPG